MTAALSLIKISSNGILKSVNVPPIMELLLSPLKTRYRYLQKRTNLHFNGKICLNTHIIKHIKFRLLFI